MYEYYICVCWLYIMCISSYIISYTYYTNIYIYILYCIYDSFVDIDTCGFLVLFFLPETAFIFGRCWEKTLLPPKNVLAPNDQE